MGSLDLGEALQKWQAAYSREVAVLGGVGFGSTRFHTWHVDLALTWISQMGPTCQWQHCLAP